jgi:hypothetical protein
MDKLTTMMKKDRENKRKTNPLNGRVYLYIGYIFLIIGMLFDIWVVYSFELSQINEKFFIGLIGLSVLFMIFAIASVMGFLLENTK